MLKLLPCCLLVLLSLTACKQEANDIQPVQSTAEVNDPATAILRAAQSSPAAAEYISGEFDGTPLYLANDKCPGQVGTFTIDKEKNTESGYFAKATPQGDVQLQLFFTNTSLFQRAMPAFWPNSKPALCEQIIVLVTQAGPNNELRALFEGVITNNQPIKVQITSVANGMVEGTFEGKLFQIDSAGKYLNNFFFVKKGKFRLKATVVSI